MTDQPENKFRQEYEQELANYKAAVQDEVAKFIVDAKAAGLLKPCPSCGQSFWIGKLLRLRGQNLEDYAPGMIDFASIMGVSSVVLQCLVLTCINCGHLLFYDAEMLSERAKDLKTVVQTIQGK